MKIKYFGRQMISDKSNKFLEDLKNKVNIPIYIIEPTSLFKIYWNMLIIFLLAYTAIVTPYRVAFADDVDSFGFFIIMNSFIDYVFTIDILVNFMSAYERYDGQVEYRLKRIALNYFTGFFWIDFLATFPFSALSSNEKANG